MFDIGFWELITIAIIGIVVVGPERLPEVVRTVAIYIRKVRRAFYNIKSDIEHELDLDNLKRQMHDLDMDEHIRKLNQSVMDIQHDIHDGLDHLQDDRAYDQMSVDTVKRHSSKDHHPYLAEEYADTGIETISATPTAVDDTQGGNIPVKSPLHSESKYSDSADTEMKNDDTTQQKTP